MRICSCSTERVVLFTEKINKKSKEKRIILTRMWYLSNSGKFDMIFTVMIHQKNNLHSHELSVCQMPGPCLLSNVYFWSTTVQAK